MAFISIPSNTIEVGDPIKKELFDLIKSDLDDLDARLTIAAEGSGIVTFFNFMIDVGSYGKTKLEYYRVPRNCIVSSFIIAIESKSPATSGILSVDLKKSSTLSDASFNSVLTTAPTINVATDPNGYSEAGIINTSVQSLNEGDWLRLDLLSLPTGLQRFHVFAIGEF